MFDNNRRRRGGGRGGSRNHGQHSQLVAEIKQRLEKFIESEEDELILEAMKKDQRAVLHPIILKMGLIAKSEGKEPNRYMVITRRIRKDPFKHTIDAQTVDLMPEQEQAIQHFMYAYPIDHRDVQAYLSLENYKVNQETYRKPFYQHRMLIPPPPRPNKQMEHFRHMLPAFHMRHQILESINRHQVILVTGGTGCGKTTQVPQFLLEDATQRRMPVKIICTQPRRLPAIAVSSRVAKERGEEHGRTVGYHIRLEQNTSEETVLTYCTSGILLRMITADGMLQHVTHIILDEVHERELNTDYLLIVLKQALKTNRNLKVILMSATMEGNRELFLNYFENLEIGHIDIPSRLFNVDNFYLPDILAMSGHIPTPSPYFTATTISARPLNGATPPKMPKICQLKVDDDEPEILEGSSSSNWSVIGPAQKAIVVPQYKTAAEKAEELADFDVQQHLDEHLPDRPHVFDPYYATKFLEAPLERQNLVQKYLNMGGMEWIESVDCDLIVSTIKYLMDSPIHGAILVFLPGYDDIMTIGDKVEQMARNFRTRPIMYSLHSQMNSGDQQKVFDPAPHGCRKVILSTNIAEASLTIDDVVFVIDSGKVKEKTYEHESRISQLKVKWIAKSNAEQRSGRAGRCQNGFCFRLFTKEQYGEMDTTQTAEMRRTAIHEVCLNAKIYAPPNVKVREFLKLAPEPPTSASIDNSMIFLEQLGAIYLQENPTPTEIQNDDILYISYKFFSTNRDTNIEPEISRLGRLMANMPLDTQLSRLLIFGLALKCFDPILTLVAALSHRDPFVLPGNDAERQRANFVKDEFAGRDFSDHSMLIRAFYEYCKCMNYHQTVNYCKAKFLSMPSMKMIYGIRTQLWQEVRRLRLVPQHSRSFDDYELNFYSTSWPMIQAAILAGCYPGVGVVKDDRRKWKIRTCAVQNAFFHPGSIVKRQVAKLPESTNPYTPNKKPKIEFLAYQELVRIEEGLTLRTITACTPLSVILFAGSLHMAENIISGFILTYNRDGPLNNNMFLIELEDWLRLQAKFTDMQLILKLRFKFMSYFLEFLRNPQAMPIREHQDLLECLNYVLYIDYRRSSVHAL